MKQEFSNPGPKETLRIEAFSDGVFAIAITLLVLELISTLHEVRGEGLLKSVLTHWGSFLAYFIGFVTIMICWINHHTAFEYIRKVDINLMWINGFLLFVVTFTPFPTAVLAEYIATESSTALAFFGFNYFLIAVAANGICSYAYNHHLINEEDRPYYYTYKLIYRYSVFYTLIVFLLCFVSIVVPIILYALMFVAFAAPRQFASRLYRIRMGRKTTRHKP